MDIIRTSIPDVLILKPEVYTDNRGYFYESYNERKFAEVAGRQIHFVQDNHSHSIKNVIRGLHYQIKHPQGKLVRVICGKIFDVAVDLRRSSESFGQWVGEIISAENKKQIWIPEGFAHGYAVLSDKAEILYKTNEFWYPEFENCVLWNDKKLNIKWPLSEKPILSVKDEKGSLLQDIEST